MSFKNVKQELQSPLTKNTLENAFGEEVCLFLHCHLRGYDKTGNGKQMNAEYYDKYGAPVKHNESWTEGYHVVEEMLGKHFDICDNNIMKFPLVAGMAGAGHLYKDIHDKDPWNWTGWIPLQKKWLCGGKFFSNRHFLAIRGNEIQNNLWDYHPHEEEEGKDLDDMEYSQIEPNDAYRGGYFFQGNAFGRYLHIIALKSHSEECNRYNYIVHPLAYRDSLNNIPDNSVDGMQWSIINIVKEENFGADKNWGEKVHGLEIFNDFTYYYSYFHEGNQTCNGKLDSTYKYVYWYNTYPLEYAEFLLESALARGVLLHTLSSNDAFYERPIPYAARIEGAESVLHADPKGHHAVNRLKHFKDVNTPRVKLKTEVKLERENADDDDELVKKLKEFLIGRPYEFNTVFGYTTLIDTKKALRDTVFGGDIRDTKLDLAGGLALYYLREGRFYSSTGIYDLFNYGCFNDKYDTQIVPYEIKDQPDKARLCYEITKDMQLIFTFAKCKNINDNAALIWRYSIMSTKGEHRKAAETVHGYFKLSDSEKTVLDLSLSYEKNNVKWLYFMAIDQDNPMRRAWFNAIKGPAFGNPQCNEKVFSEEHPVPQHKVFSTKNKHPGHIIQSDEPIKLFSIKNDQLDFHFRKTDEKNIYVYFMQAYPQQQESNDATENSSDELPPRYRQNVHGYFTLNEEYPTRLNLSNCWDKESVNEVYFYQIDTVGQPMDISAKPKPYSAF